MSEQDGISMVLRDVHVVGGLTSALAWFPFPGLDGGAGDPSDLVGGGDGFAMSAHPATFRSRNPASVALKYLFAIALSLIILVPLVTAVLGGFKSNADLQNNSFGLPRTLVWSNYAAVCDAAQPQPWWTPCGV